MSSSSQSCKLLSPSLGSAVEAGRFIALRTGSALAERASVLHTLACLRELYSKSCVLQA